MSDKDILNDKENIIMQQDLMNTENEEKYQLILGYYFCAYINKYFC